MSTSDQNLDVSKQNSKRRHDIDQNKDKNQDQYYKLDEYLHDHCKKKGKVIIVILVLFSVTRRSRSDVSHLLTYSLTH